MDRCRQDEVKAMTESKSGENISTFERNHKNSDVSRRISWNVKSVGLTSISEQSVTKVKNPSHRLNKYSTDTEKETLVEANDKFP